MDLTPGSKRERQGQVHPQPKGSSTRSVDSCPSRAAHLTVACVSTGCAASCDSGSTCTQPFQQVNQVETKKKPFGLAAMRAVVERAVAIDCESADQPPLCRRRAFFEPMATQSIKHKHSNSTASSLTLTPTHPTPGQHKMSGDLKAPSDSSALSSSAAAETGLSTAPRASWTRRTLEGDINTNTWQCTAAMVYACFLTGFTSATSFTACFVCESGGSAAVWVVWLLIECGLPGLIGPRVWLPDVSIPSPRASRVNPPRLMLTRLSHAQRQRRPTWPGRRADLRARHAAHLHL